MRIAFFFLVATTLLLAAVPRPAPRYDTIIRNGLVYDGYGGTPYKADIGLNADTIAFIGDLSGASGTSIVDAKGLAVAPGFINMMGHSEESLFQDGRAQSDVRQGVTTEIFDEMSYGPLNDRMKEQMQKAQGDITFPVTWNTLGQYMHTLERHGISCNIASFVGAGTVRQHVIGENDRPPTAPELEKMRRLVKDAMEDGALGLTCALIYPPDNYATTSELVALAKVASAYGGTYISHMRSEGNKLLEAVNETLTIAREASIPVEICHLKVAGRANWPKMSKVIAAVEDARSRGVDITANMYPYTAGATGLTASFPPSLQDGGFGMLRRRLQQPAVRAKMAAAFYSDAADWENLFHAAGGAGNVLLLSFKQDSLKKFTGKTLAEVATVRGTPVAETAMDLIIQDSTRVGVAYFLMDEANVRKAVALPWVSFGSDEASYTPEGVFLKSSAHPRAYGTFARVLGHYTRVEKLMTVEQAIYKLANLPATHLKLQKRGALKRGNFADVVVFDPATITDHATYANPHQYATGVVQVFINGTQVVADGEHTGATPGRFLKGPGYHRS